MDRYLNLKLRNNFRRYNTPNNKNLDPLIKLTNKSERMSVLSPVSRRRKFLSLRLPLHGTRREVQVFRFESQVFHLHYRMSSWCCRWERGTSRRRWVNISWWLTHLNIFTKTSCVSYYWYPCHQHGTLWRFDLGSHRSESAPILCLPLGHGHFLFQGLHLNKLEFPCLIIYF